jgi:branched-chain amino acid transport system substrate-binding protein
MLRTKVLSVAVVTAAICLTTAVRAEPKYDPGASATEIKIGNTMPYSGPNTSFAVLGKVFDGYYRRINDRGGINGRKLNFISYDDAFNPSKTVEQTRKLVESDQVLFLAGSLGTAMQAAVQRYLNDKKVPQLFVMGASSRWEDPKNFPWTMGMVASYRSEGRIFAKYLLKEKPTSKLAVIYQNDDYGKDILKGLREGLGDRQEMIVATESFEITEPTIDTHIVKLKASGADVFLDFTPPKFAAQAIRKVNEIGWRPFHILNSVGSSIGTAIRPAGFENAQGIVSTIYNKDPSDPRWAEDPAIRDYKEFLQTYVPSVSYDDLIAIGAFNYAQTLVQVLKQCGDDLTRENVMRQAANLKDFAPTAIYPGIKFNTSPTDYAVMKDLQMVRFEGDRWVPFGPVITGY